MKKISFTIVVVLLITFCSLAQIKTTANVGVQIPTGDMNAEFNTGYGGSVTFDLSLPLLPISITASFGYNRWKFKDNNIYAGYNSYTIPLTAGIRYNSSGSGINTYFGGDIGYAISNANYPGSASSSDFVYSPVLGFKYGLTPIGLVLLDFNLRYWAVSQSSGVKFTWFGLNAGITFGL